MAKKTDVRARKDLAGIGPYVREGAHLVPLHEMKGWTIAEGDPDIRGWSVRTIGGRELGEVSDLLVDEELGEVVLLDVDRKASDRHSYVPIRAAQVERERHLVLVDSGDLYDQLPTATRAPGAPLVERRATGTVRYPAARVEAAHGEAVTAAAAHGETVIEQRPVVVEEVVVRRRVVDPEHALPPADETRDER